MYHNLLEAENSIYNALILLKHIRRGKNEAKVISSTLNSVNKHRVQLSWHTH